MTATITVLAEKGSPLSHTEMDNNFRALRNLVEVPTVTALRALGDGAVPAGDGTVITQGCLAAGDGGGGTWRWDATVLEATPDNTGTIVKPTGHTGNGAWVRVFNGRVDTKWFGLTSAAIQSAVDWAAAQGFGVHLSAGEYAVTESIELPSNTDIVGDGLSSVLSIDAIDISAIMITATEGAPKENITLRNFYIRGTNTYSDLNDENTSGIFGFESISNITIEGVAVSGTGSGSITTGTIGAGICLYSVENVVISKCRFWDNMGVNSDIRVFGGSQNIIITENLCLSTGNKGGIFTSTANIPRNNIGFIVVSNNVVKDNAVFGILLSYSDAITQPQITCTGNVVYNCGYYGIRFDGGLPVYGYGGSVAITGNTVAFCGGEGEPSSINAAIMIGPSVGPVAVSSNTIYASGYSAGLIERSGVGRGISVLTANNILVANNTIDLVKYTPTPSTPSAAIFCLTNTDYSCNSITIRNNDINNAGCGLFADLFNGSYVGLDWVIDGNRIGQSPYTTAVLTSTGVAPVDGSSVTIGAVIYTFKTALSTGPEVPYEVLIGGSAAAALDNLKSAINATAGAGTTYGTGTVIHPDVAATYNTNTYQVIQANTNKTATAPAVATTSVALSWSAWQGPPAAPWAGMYFYRTKLENLQLTNNIITRETTASDSSTAIRFSYTSLKPSVINRIAGNVLRGFDFGIDSTSFGDMYYGTYTLLEDNKYQKMRIGIYYIADSATSFQYDVRPYHNNVSYPYAKAGSYTTHKIATQLYPNKIIYDTAKPASGSWALYDRVINSEPAVGEAPAWVCVSAGTPGTWAAEAVLTA